MKQFDHKESFLLESGQMLPGIAITYHAYGKLNEYKSNVVWICHHLTANSDAATWWNGIVGEGRIFDPAKYFIVCANILGSCYGSSGPLSINPATGEPYYQTFPQLTIRDMVNAHILLRKHLGINHIELLIGGSMGGYQALEWSVMEKERVGKLILLCSSAAESAWGIAVHTAQRLAIEADSSWKDPSPHAGRNGLKAARAIGLISYRNYRILVEKQTDPDKEKTDHFKAASYILYQGEKLVNRFNAYSYWLLTKAMDSHQLARGRNQDIQKILNGILQRTLIIGVQSDILCPLPEQQLLADQIPNSVLSIIDSAYGHDGFIVEGETISRIINDWLNA
ncbi:MAG TPA: homoserine O-acetyltransferase [Flavitalea sp.]|nr:homoserine O-acetyltransferase [Flavitalea sp.]